MNKVFVSVLAIALLASVTGCTSKSSYDKLLNEKVSIETEQMQVIKDNARLKSDNTMLKKVQEDQAKLAIENTRLKNNIAKLTNDKDTLIRQLKDSAKKVAAMTAEASKVKE